MHNQTFAAVSLALGLVLTGCPKDNTASDSDGPMTQGEAHEALEESTADSQAAALTTNSIEISTNFTIGKAVADAAGELRTFIETQLPCADIDLEGSTLTVTYGAKPGNCAYRGHTFSGEHKITVTKDDDGDVEVDHEWTDLSNGIVKVTGTAHVTWSLANKSRHATHELTWTRISDGRTGTGTADIAQTALPEGVATGIQIDGSRSWTGKTGKWDLAVQGVQVRWQDPVPQAGTYQLASPKGRSLVLSFARVDEDTIAVTLKNDTKEFTFKVNSLGAVGDQA
jgi:hypothetical protein